jgi:hypothetical protein
MYQRFESLFTRSPVTGSFLVYACLKIEAMLDPPLGSEGDFWTLEKSLL